MGSQATQPQMEETPGELFTPQWSFVTRVAFRFCFIYFGLFCLSTQIFAGVLPLGNFEFPDPATLPPMRQIVTWTAVHIFGVTKPLVYLSGSGDKTFDWVLVFCLLVVAMLATAAWSVLDGKRQNYTTLYKWFRLFIRFCLAGQMIGYGLAKAVPLQMPYPNLTRLVEPFGNFSPMGVLWYSIGASPAYETFAGCAELLGGILLITPRTTLLGALVCLADMTQVFMLNMTYDVPVKLLSFHLILLSLFLLAPEMQRLANFFLLNRPVGSSTRAPLFTTPRANRIALALQVILGLLILGTNVYSSITGWYLYGAGSPKSALYGIWDVTQLTIDGQTRSPLLNDYGRWRRVIFDNPSAMSFERMDDTFVRYSSAINANEKTVALTQFDDKAWKANFGYQRAASDQLILDGDMDSHKVRMQLQLVDRGKFLLVNRGFHWVQEYPFNR